MSDTSTQFTPECLFCGDCLSALEQRAQLGDAHAQRAARFLACICEFMAERMLTGGPNDPPDQRQVRPLPKALHPILDQCDCSALRDECGDKLLLLASGTMHAIVEDKDWTTHGSGGTTV